MELNFSCGRSAELKGVVFLLCLDKTKRDKIKKRIYKWWETRICIQKMDKTNQVNKRI